MRGLRGLGGAALALWLAGCANFGAVSEFAHETSNVSHTVCSELAQLDTLCRDQAELTIVVADLPDDGPLQACDNHRAAQGRLAVFTLDVLDDYARVLSALAADKSFDLTSDVNTVGKRVAALQGKGGAPVVSRGESMALTQIAQALAEIATERARDRAVRRLAAEAPNLAQAGRTLRALFVADASAGTGRATAPYANIVALTRDAFDTTQKQFRQARFRQAEPLRTAELLRAMRARDAQLLRRTGSAPDSVPVMMAAAIDAWLEALDVFAQEALQPERGELMRRIKAQHSKTAVARDAFEAEDHR